MRALTALDRALSALERAVLAGALGAMLVLAFAQVVLRNFAHTGWPPAETIVRFLVLVIAFAGGSLAAGRGRHLHIELISRFLPPRLGVPSVVLTQLGAALVCVLLTRAAWGMAVSERAGGSLLIAGVPSWWAAAVFPAGFGMLSLRFLLHAVRMSVERKLAVEDPPA